MSAHLVLVDDGVPASTIDLLLRAARRRAVTTQIVTAASMADSQPASLAAGHLLYRPAVSPAARRTERFLIGPDVVSFYTDIDGPRFNAGDPMLAFARAGVHTVPSRWITTRRRPLLDDAVEQLGGFPVVVKVPGGEGGVGVMQVDSRPAFFSLVDFLLANNYLVHVQRFISDGRHIRAVVVGDRVVAAYRNHSDTHDFRTIPSRDVRDYHLSLTPSLTALAVTATRAIGVEFAGVDLLLDRDDRPYVLEANFPCFHPQAELVAGVPVSDAMVGHLLEKRARRFGHASPCAS